MFVLRLVQKLFMLTKVVVVDIDVLAILFTRSQYFRGLFQSGMKETKQSSLKFEAPFESFLEIVRYLYKDSPSLTGENAVNVMILSDEYGINR
jgi:hypothetical protein